MPEAAVAYCVHLWRADGRTRSRIQRRILVSAAEDCFSIPVMQSVSAWINGPRREDLHEAVRQVLLIIETPCWYALPDGRHYIRAWRQAEVGPNAFLGKRQSALELSIATGVMERSPLPALQAFLALTAQEDFNPLSLSECLTRLACVHGGEPASRLSELYAENVRHLWRDSNWSGQALWALLAGPIGPQELPNIYEDKLSELVAMSLAQHRVPPVADWCKDGIHVAGCDRRFSGSLAEMALACDAFERLGRLCPSDDWGDFQNE